MFKNLQLIIVLSWMVSFVNLSGLCFAQALTAEHHAYKVGGWQLNELTDNQGETLGFWAIPRGHVSVGTIRRMWFESLPGDEWAIWAYEPVQANAVAADLYLNADMSLSSLEFFYSCERKALSTLNDQGVDGGVQGLVEKGFIAGDPLTETVGALSDPTPMINLLADVSYPIAPGMTELLVSGTAGVNVNMNHATKQLLNCLESTSSSACGECVCVETQAPPSYGTWTVTQSSMPPPDNRIRCDYSRVVTYYYWQTGEYPEDCTDCTVGSSTNPATYTETEEHTDMWLDVTECPDYPLLPR